MPRIQTNSLAAHRDWRRSQLIDAAAEIALESGGDSITVAAVAQRAGLSRTSVYEYFSSSADLVADLVIEELDSLAHDLKIAVSGETEPYKAIEVWIFNSLLYIADGRHLLAKALNAAELPRDRSRDIGSAHRALLAPLSESLEKIGISDLPQCLALLQSITDVATKRIENGADAESEINKTIAFCIAGIRSLI